MQTERLLTVEEAAKQLRVHPESVRRWLRNGTIHGHRLTRRAGWRVPESELRRFLEEGMHEGKRAA